MPRAHRNFDAADLLGPILIVVTPFISFLKLNEYGYFSPESLILILVLVGAGSLLGLVAAFGGRFAATILTAFLITIYIEFQLDWPLGRSILVPVMQIALLAGLWWLGQHRMTVVCAIFGTILVATLLFPVDGPIARPSQQKIANSAQLGDTANALPIVVHLVLDGHIGIAGIPPDIPGADKAAADMRAFYSRFGFQRFDNAYSQYFNSYLSLSQLVNLGLTDRGAFVTNRGKQEWSVRRNEYFRGMAKRGHSISVYQTKYMDFCLEKSVPYATCRTSRYDSLKYISQYNFATSERLRILATVYANLFTQNSMIYTATRSFYQRTRTAFAKYGWHLPNWGSSGNILTAPIMAVHALNQLSADIVNAKPGDFFFAHLLLPHSPYIFDANCGLRPIANWWLERGNSQPSVTANPHEKRKTHYQDYFQQLACTYRHLEKLMVEIERHNQNIAVIFQGDHGSRITVSNLFFEPGSKMSERDFVDTFSTLFAVRLPDGHAGNDLQQVTIVRLLEDLYQREFRSVPKPQPTAAVPTVFLKDEHGKFVDFPFVMARPLQPTISP